MSESIAHYEILGEIAAGTLGPVYRARDTKVGRTVAIRVVSAGMAEPAQRARAIDLIQPFTALTHPHVATLFDVGERRGAIYLVYEYVPGEKLDAAIDGRPMNLRRALDLGEQVADALAEAHSLDLVHGALTPSSIFVTPKGHAKVLDFGLSAGVLRTWEGRNGRLPREAYASPERIRGGPPDAASDLFALGAILHEMLTGRRAFPGRSAADVTAQVLTSHPARPSLLNRDLPRELDAVVARALAKEPGRRYQGAAQLAADLRDAAASAQARPAASDIESAGPARRGRRFRVAAAALLLTAAVAAGGWQWGVPLRDAWQSRFAARLEPSLVVMPFQVAGLDQSRSYFGAGFAEDLARRLGQVPGVSTPGRSGIRASAGKPPQSVAAGAGAAAAVVGTLTPADEDWTSVRVDVSLVDAGRGRVVWSAAHSGPVQDVFALQARITREIAGRLDVAYEPTPGHGRAMLRLVGPDAYDSYLRALAAMASHDASRAAQLFEAAADADPGLVEAQAGLALALGTASAFEGREHAGDVHARARGAAEAAFAADPDSALTKLAMGLTAPTVGEAIEHLQAAHALDASETGALLGLAAVLRPGDPGRALAFARRAAELDPAHPVAPFLEALAHLSAGRRDEALAAAARGQSLDPALPWWEAVGLRVRLARQPGTRGAPPPAAPGSRDVGDFPPATILRAAELVESGRPGDALTMLGSLTRLHPGSCEARAMTAAVLTRAGRRGEAQRIAAGIWARAAAAPEGSCWAQCGYMAAAAVNDPGRAAAWLGRVASSPPELRAWGEVSGLLDGLDAARDRVFPWSNVAGAPAVVEALSSLRAALSRTASDAARILHGM